MSHVHPIQEKDKKVKILRQKFFSTCKLQDILTSISLKSGSQHELKTNGFNTVSLLKRKINKN